MGPFEITHNKTQRVGKNESEALFEAGITPLASRFHSLLYGGGHPFSQEPTVSPEGLESSPVQGGKLLVAWQKEG
jgi:hypothetical protein